MNATLDTLRTAHGVFVATVLSRADRVDPTLVVGSVVAQNRWAAAQLRALPTNVEQPTTPTRDVATLLAELAASCAEFGQAMRSLPADCPTEQVLDRVIGHYREQTQLLQRGTLR